MPIINIDKEQADHLDLIIKTAIQSPEKIRTVKQINEFLISNKSYDYCLSLYYILYEFSPSIIHHNSRTDIFWITEYAIAFLHDGGFSKLYERASEKQLKENLKQNQKDKSDALDYQIKHWTYKARYLPFFLSICALIVSIFSYFKPEKKQPNLELMQSEIEQLKKGIKKIDTLHHLDTLWKKSR